MFYFLLYVTILSSHFIGIYLLALFYIEKINIMKKTTLIILGIAILAIIAIFALGKKDKEIPTNLATLTGSVTYRERMALPENSMVTIVLQDTSKMDVSAETIAEMTIPTQGKQVPIDFSLDYDANKINPQNNYSLSTKITSGENLLWVNANHTPVITHDNPTSDIEIVLNRSTVKTSQPTTIPAVPLEGTTFNIVAHNGKLAPTENTYSVTFADGSVQAKFCNGMGGEYTYEDYTVKAPMMISTMMFCESPEGLMDIEQLFGKMLSEGAHVTISGDVLELATDTDTLIFQAK